MATLASWTALRGGDKYFWGLLIKARLDASGYEILLTDLSRMWGETLSRSDIVQRAINNSSSIDPSQDAGQYKILLQKIESALNGEERTSLDLHSSTKDSQDELVLKLSAALPGPLPPLQWEVNLKILPAQCLETELVTPLLCQARSLQYQRQELIGELHDKDRIISKVTDRLESSGNDLTTVFPGVSNVRVAKSKSQRDQLAQHVRGLSDFEEGSWRARHENMVSNESTLNTAELNSIFCNVPAAGKKRETIEMPAEWWRKLSITPTMTIQRQDVNETDQDDDNDVDANDNSKQAYQIANSSQLKQDDSIVDDDFQRQSTPPSVKQQPSVIGRSFGSSHYVSGSAQQLPTEEPGDDEETEEEDDLDAPPRNQAKRSPRTPPPIQTGLLETTTPSQIASVPRKQGSTRRHHNQPSPASSLKQQPVETASPVKLQTKLGTLGGRAKSTKAPEPRTERQSSPNGPLSSVSQHVKLGDLSGKQSKEAPPEMSGTTETPVQGQEAALEYSRTVQEEAAPTPRGTSEEKADRKRDQLKRELEARTKHPVKRKRKF